MAQVTFTFEVPVTPGFSIPDIDGEATVQREGGDLFAAEIHVDLYDANKKKMVSHLIDETSWLYQYAVAAAEFAIWDNDGELRHEIRSDEEGDRADYLYEQARDRAMDDA